MKHVTRIMTFKFELCPISYYKCITKSVCLLRLNYLTVRREILHKQYQMYRQLGYYHLDKNHENMVKNNFW